MKYTHRIGTITFGISLIAFGVAFLLHLFIPKLSITTVIAFWPSIFILLGVEVLISLFSRYGKDKIIYDKVGIILTALLIFFAMGMGSVSLIMEHAVQTMR